MIIWRGRPTKIKEIREGSTHSPIAATHKLAALDSRDIGRIGAGVITPRPQLLIQFDLAIQPVAFFFGPIHPMNRGGLGQLRRLVHSSQQVLVLAQRNCMVSMFHRDGLIV